MRRIRPGFFTIFIIIAIAGISVAITMVYFSESNAGLVVDEEWALVVSDTPTLTIAPSLTFFPHNSPTSLAPPSPASKTNCVYPAEYWEEHPELWLEMLVGNSMYNKDDIRQLFDDPSQEIHQILLKQLYLSNLNVFSGADPDVIKDELGGANQWLQNYLYEPPSEEDQLAGVQLAQKLSDFNSGLVGPGFCSPYLPVTATATIFVPTATLSPTATSTATRFLVTFEPSATATKTKKPDKEPEPTDPPRPTQEPDTPVPPPPPTEPPPPKPTIAPPENTPEPTDPPDKPTPTPAS